VTIPYSVTYIEPRGAFQYCNSLMSVIVLNPTPPKLVQDSKFRSLDGSFPDETIEKGCLYVPSGSIDAYRSANGWNEFSCIKDVASL